MKTGRPPKSDAEKRQAGTFDPRFSEAARVERAEAKVVALFGQSPLAQIPEPPAGLSEAAADEYWRWARHLHSAGRLTQVWVDKILFYAIRRHSIMAKLNAGKLPKDGDQKACEMFLKEIGAANIDQPIAGQDKTESKWAKFGFAARGRG